MHRMITTCPPNAPVASNVPTEPTFGVYIHWPFCAQKCPYCDFNSHVRHGGWDEDRFLAAYKRELSYVAKLLANSPLPVLHGERARVRGGDRAGASRTVTSIFFGGGTPSLMKAATTAAILDHIASLWPIEAGAEITLEANPGSVEAERFAGYRSAGVNRVSMGLQSLRDDQLKRLGRIHTVAESKTALDIARRTFDRFSFDLIYARPGQTPQEWRAELKEALALAGRHLSLYQLTIEPDTPFAALHAAGKLVVPDNEAALALYEVTQDLTGAAGLPAYEISNHASPGEESQHNLLYWRYGEYAGIGPGAHGRLVFGGARHATVAERGPEAWAGLVERVGHGFNEITPLTRNEQADEMLLMGLRLAEGLDLDRLAAVGCVKPSEAMMAELVSMGLLETVGQGRCRRNPPAANAPPGGGLPFADPSHDSEAYDLVPRRIRATRRGRFVLNEIVLRLSQSFAASAELTNRSQTI